MSQPDVLEWFPFHHNLMQRLQDWDQPTWSRWCDHVNQVDFASVMPEAFHDAPAVSPEEDPVLHELLEQARNAVSFQDEIALHVIPSSQRLNAFAWLNGTNAHLLLQGDFRSKLDAQETLAIFGHELGHLHLMLSHDRAWLVIDRWLAAATQASDLPAWQRTHELHRQLTEVYCDRLALHICQDLSPCVSALMKVEGQNDPVPVVEKLAEIQARFQTLESPPIQQQQKSEISAVDLRIRALQVWHESSTDASSAIQELFMQPGTYQGLSLLDQPSWAAWTLSTVSHWLSDPRRQSPQVAALASTLRDEVDLPMDEIWPLPEVDRWIQQATTEWQDYACFLLLDLVTADVTALEQVLASALQWADRWKLTEAFETMARRELRLRKRQLQRIREQLPQHHEPDRVAPVIPNQDEGS